MAATAERAAEPAPSLKFLHWLLLLAVAMLALYQTRPPAARGADAPLVQFSAARASVHLDHIATEPHPMGSAANHRVRDYLVQQLESLGGEVRVEHTVGLTSSGRHIYAGTAQNIVARFPGVANSRAILLVAHYDSVPHAPGAADDGAGVIAILETVRALRILPPLQNDLLVLFTDGEEEGLIGATGFVADRPDRAAQIGLVLNFEARGSSGPALMFETSPDNGWLVREFARVAPYPMASSLAYAVYQHLPNDTDMTVFKRAGLPGMNFAFTATFQNYHTPLDAPENLDLRSVQHFGDNTLAMVRHFGNLRLEDVRQPDRVYFNWIGSRLVDYPPVGAWLLLAVLVVLFLVVVVIGRRKDLLSYTGIAGGVGGFLLILAVMLGGAHGSWWAVMLLINQLQVGDTTANKLLMLGCLGVGVALSLPVQRWLGSRLGYKGVAAGQLLAAGAVAVAVTIGATGASYAFQWPVVFGLTGLAATLVARKASIAAWSVFFGALAVILILVPLNYLLFVALGLNTLSISVVAVFFVFFLAATSPFLLHAGFAPRWLPLALFGCSLVLLGIGQHLSRSSAEHPQRNTIVYSFNADRSAAEWISYDPTIDPWTSQFLGSGARRGANPAFTLGFARDVLSAEAPPLPLEAPAVTIVSDSAEGGQRRLRLRIASSRGASVLLMRAGPEVKLLGLVVNGRVSEANPVADAPWSFRYNAAPPEGIEMELLLGSLEPFTCWIGDRSLGLPEFPDKGYRPRPADQIPGVGSDMVLVARQHTF